MNIVDYITFAELNGSKIHRIPVYGNCNDPMFLANDIICSLFGMENINKDWFFQSNKRDTRYIMRSEILTSSAELQERFKKSNKDHIYFFTEIGLYKCLFRSKHPIADAFQERVALLLKDLRLGNLKLQQQRESEFMNLTEERNNIFASLMTIQQRSQEQELQINSLSRLLESAYQNVVIYRITIVSSGLIYIGKTIDIVTREQAHRMRSSNTTLRKAYEDGEEMIYVVVANVRCLTTGQSKYLEREHILSVPAHLRINVQIPEVLDEGALSAEFKQIVRQSIEAPLNVTVSQWVISNAVEEEKKEQDPEEIKDDVAQSDMYDGIRSDDYKDYIESARDAKFKEQINDIYNFHKDNQFYPRDSTNVTGEEKKLARLCVKIRTQARCQGVGDGKYYALTKERYAYVIHMMPGFFDQYDSEAIFKAKIDKIAAFCNAHQNRFPVPNPDDANENQMNDFLNKTRTAYNGGKLAVSRESYCRSVLPMGVFKDEKDVNDGKFESNVRLLKEWYINNGSRFPKQADNKQHYLFIKTCKSAISQPDKQSFKLGDNRKEFIRKQFPELATLIKL